MMLDTKVLVIIVTYNGKKWIKNCFDSVRNSETPATIFVVDNKSTDDTVATIKSNYPEAIVIESDKNLGFGAANNLGFEYAIEHNFDYVYLLNQDAWIAPNTIGTLIEINRKYPSYGVLSPLQTNGDATKLDKNFAEFVSENSEILSDYIFNTTKELYQTEFTMAAHWLVSKECFTKVGQFSPLFYHYGEDDNYLHRAKYFGFKNGVVPSVIGVHDRELREMSKEKDIYRIPIIFLIQASNINHSFTKSLIKAYINCFRSIVAKSKEYKDPKILLMSFSLLSKISKIYHYRKKNMQINQ